MGAHCSFELCSGSGYDLNTVNFKQFKLFIEFVCGNNTNFKTGANVHSNMDADMEAYYL
jgi:hypothetical protein